MKTLIWVLAFVTVVSVDVRGVQIGEHVSQVRRELGEPKGYLRMDTFELLCYDRGRVKCRDGRVVDMDLVSPEELAVRRDDEARQRARQAREVEERRVRMTARGEALKSDKLSDPAFLAGSAADRLRFWTAFRKLYQDVNVDVEYGETLLRFEHDLALEEEAREREREQAAAERRLVELERRVLDAEARARNAEDVAYDARRDRGNRFYYPASVVTPVLQHGAHNPCRNSPRKGSSIQVSIGGQIVHQRGDPHAAQGSNCRTTVFRPAASKRGIAVMYTRCEPDKSESTPHAAFRARMRAQKAAARSSFHATYSSRSGGSYD